MPMSTFENYQLFDFWAFFSNPMCVVPHTWGKTPILHRSKFCHFSTIARNITNLWCVITSEREARSEFLFTSEAEGRVSSTENKGKSWVWATGRPAVVTPAGRSPIGKRSSLVGTPIPSTVYGTNTESCQYPLWHVARTTWRDVTNVPPVVSR